MYMRDSYIQYTRTILDTGHLVATDHDISPIQVPLQKILSNDTIE